MAEKIDLRPKVLDFIQRNGPSIPRDVVKEVGGDTLIIGAVLMQLKDSGKIFVTHTKIGGTPAYYCEGQEEMLQNLEKYLNDKERYAYDLLKEKKILRDYDLPTVVRLSLRIIKDFATPLVVDVNGEDEIFWKWYLTSLVDAEGLIKQILPKVKSRVLEKVEEEKQEIIEEKEVVIDMAKEAFEKEEDTEDIEEKEEDEKTITLDDEDSKEEIIQKTPQEIAETIEEKSEEIKEEEKKVLKDDKPKKEEFVVKAKKEKRIKAIKKEKVKKTKITKHRDISKKEKSKKKKTTSKSEKTKEKPKKEGFFKRIKKLFW